MRLYEIRSVAEMESVRLAWARLASAAPRTTPFQSWEWNHALARLEGDRVHLRIVVAEDNHGEVVGIAPFCVRSGGLLGQRVLELLGSRKSDYVDLVAAEGHREAFTERVCAWVEGSRDWRVLDLPRLRLGLAGRLGRIGGFTAEPFDVCPYARLPDRVERYEARLSSRLRGNVGRHLRRLTREGRLGISIARTVSEVRAALPVLLDLHMRRLTARGEVGAMHDAHWRALFEEAVLAFAAADRVRLGLLTIDGRPAAGNGNLRWGDREYSYIGGLEPALARSSPGSLLEYSMIAQAIRDGVREYDFGIGSEPYKASWTDAACELWRVSGARSRMAHLIWRQRQSWRTAARRSALVRRLYRATVSTFS